MTYSDLDRPPLDASALRRALVDERSWWREVHVSRTTGSTNADHAVLAGAGAPEGTLVTTDLQTSGRGRLDRVWTTPQAAALAVSVLVAPDDVPAARWSWLPLVTGLAVVEAVESATGVAATLKWPNDALVEERKLAGILLERVETPHGPRAVVGVGINVRQRADELPVPTATSLVLEGAAEADRAVLLRVFARTFEALYRAWAAAEGDPTGGVQEAYVRRCTTVGRQVRVTMPIGPDLLGEAVAVDADGRLVVRAGDREHALSAGDVTHVRPHP